MLDVVSLWWACVCWVYQLVLAGCEFLGWNTRWAETGLKKAARRRLDRGSTRVRVGTAGGAVAGATAVRVPSHLAVLCTDKGVEQSQLCQLAEACLSAGIGRLSVFDQWGEAEMAGETLRQRMGRRADVLIGPCCSPARALSPDRLTVQLLAADSGKAQLVQVARKLLSSPSPLSASSISSSLLSCHLYEPDVVLWVGRTPSFAGFPPWALRVSELLPVARLPTSRAELDACCADYAKRDQRLGK